MAFATRKKLSRQKNYPGDSLACGVSIGHADLGQEGFVVVLFCLHCTGGIQLQIEWRRPHNYFFGRLLPVRIQTHQYKQ